MTEKTMKSCNQTKKVKKSKNEIITNNLKIKYCVHRYNNNNMIKYFLLSIHTYYIHITTTAYFYDYIDESNRVYYI